jgi:Ser/Thr protein kinase RdoA (MazF antagonist)
MPGESVRPLLLEAARAFNFPVEQVTPLGGATGLTWVFRDHVLRMGDGSRLDVEEAAIKTAAAQMPVSDVLDRVDLPNGKAVLLLTLLPGHPAGNLEGLTEARAKERGRVCGRLHARLAETAAPPGIPAEAEKMPVAARGMSDRLLHLDLHPFNVLVEDDRVSGVVDWANAAAGDPLLDRARSWSILTLDPAASARRADARWSALVDGWLEAGQLTVLPSAARTWSCRFMLKDLSRRYRHDQLGAVRAALTDCERALEEE